MLRGEVGEVRFDPVIGAEIMKVRPCVIVSRDSLAKLPLRIIVPLTQWNERFTEAPWHVPVEATTESGLSKKSSADTFQVRSVSQNRFVRRIGVLPERTMLRISSAMKLCLMIP